MADDEVLTLSWTLAELPSSQHRAGLAGLVLMVNWLRRRSDWQGICELTSVGPHGASVRFDFGGLVALLDEVYAASREEQGVRQPWKKKGEIVPPLRVEERQLVSKAGKTSVKRYYIYPTVVPAGAFLAELDPVSPSGPWISLWRRMIWTIMRGIPAQRRPFERRAAGAAGVEASRRWKELHSPGVGVALPSTYFLGAQDRNAEQVPFRDQARVFFLLEFWTFVAQVYVPRALKGEKLQDQGFAIVVPDVASLEDFCEDFRASLRNRNGELVGSKPAGALVDLPAQAGLEGLRQLRQAAAKTEAKARYADLLTAVDVFHLDKQGNSVKVLGTSRLAPEPELDAAYERFRAAYRDHVFRRQRLSNLLQHRPWWAGFAAVLSTTRSVHDRRHLRRDARAAFTNEVSMSENDRTLEARLYKMVGTYLGSRLRTKHELTWEAAQGDEAREKAYRAKREKLAREAFLAIRSRTGADFIEYFASTLCSVTQRMDEASYLALSRALHERPEDVRTLTMLALSARA